jgi:cytochrome c
MNVLWGAVAVVSIPIIETFRRCATCRHQIEAFLLRAISTIFAIAFLVAAVAPACAQQSAPESEGQAILAKNCSMCHAIGRSGKSPHPVAPPFRTLSRNYEVGALEEALGEGLSSGHPDMPEFVFPPNQINGIISYLRSIQER